MISERVDLTLDSDQLEKAALDIAHTIHSAVMEGGEGTRKLADLLHGTWLGHPLHPVLTDVVVGAWTIGTFFDLVSLFKKSHQVEMIADALIQVGNFAALPTILSGLADFSTIPEPAANIALAHATANSIGFALQVASTRARNRGDRERALSCSGLAFVFLTTGAYLGGHLAYAKKVGVKYFEDVTEPQEWSPALEATKIREREPRRVDVAGQPVLLYRQGNQIQAIGAVCPHSGGPLEQGKFANGCVQCPWHDSVFDLADGRVVHGPSTYAATNYETRIRNGMVEVRVVPVS
ncbi:MAG: Rieske 2Fe-2S domain-containing protein [Chloroflexi bacterium]|nr:Rieske 2Fe-2S domain-containing protein [Chloroflexota bacterium]